MIILEIQITKKIEQVPFRSYKLSVIYELILIRLSYSELNTCHDFWYNDYKALYQVLNRVAEN